MSLPDRVAAALSARPAPVCAYVYDPAAAAVRAAEVRAALPAGTTLLYAVKANGHPALVQALARACDGLEVASGGELQLAAGAGARSIVFGGPGKTDAELALALRAGAQINVESAHELRRLDALAGAAGVVADVCLRINRSAAGPPGSHAMTGTPTAFGIDETQLGAVLALDTPHVRVIGFHLHAVSNNLDGSAHARFLTDSLDWSVTTAAEYGLPLRVVNAGGGLGVDYRSGASMDLTALRGVRVPAGVTLIVEPGRFLAADAGWYATTVLDLKRTHGRWFAVVRGGTHHFRLPAAWGYSHPFTVLPVPGWPYPWERPSVSGTEVDVAGELCTPRDVLARGERVGRLRVGDVLVFARTGAYGWDISHHDFLRHPPPEFVVL
ncbi:alanine racemase [Symbioplanes lichenis]|uniref:alanine racemase n=1 Tax=Symbioplanes lichenis TaxID=1629072 RepID=UPI002738F098|nr:alanine racemase [Actinoplanes lichenis]